MTPTTSLLDQILDPLAEILSDDAAQRVVELKLDSQIQDRIDELAARASSGELSSEERAEYEDLVDAIDLLGVFKAKARASLARRSA